MNQHEILENLGLSKTEGKVYLAALELGESLHSVLAKKAGIKRPTLYYEVLPNLIKQGLITETIKGKRKYLVAQDFGPFVENKKNQIDEAEKLLPQLRLLLATASAKPKLLLYDGIEGVKKVWFDHLIQRQSILELANIEHIHPDLQKYIKNYYILERIKRRINEKMLVSGPTKSGIFNVKTDPYELREVKTIDEKIFPFPASCNIYGENVSFTIYRKNTEPLGLIIRSKEIATTMRSLFNFIWDKA